MTWSDVPISVDEIVDGKIYIGNLSAALSLEWRSKLGISHVLSVCPEYPSTGPKHLTICVQDTEYEDLLIHLIQACQFIQSALDEGGKILVHCVMGVSRSTTVVCAYLMATRRCSASAAIHFIRKHRAQVHPNYGFLKQLQCFADCRYKPSCAHPEYISWKRRQKREVTRYLNMISDTIPVIPDQLYLNTELPSDPDAADSLLLDMGMTHILSLSSAQFAMPQLPPTFTHQHIDIPNQAREALLLEMPAACKFIGDAIASGGQVLVHCRVELRACIVVCAYLMSTRKIPPRQAFRVLESALPLFIPTSNFYRHLELFAACSYNPTLKHPLVQAWIAELTFGHVPPGKTIGKATSSSSRVVRNYTVPAAPYDMATVNEALARIQTTSFVKV